MASPKFSNTSQSFHAELKKRISDYFKQAGKASTGSFSLYLKAGILIVSFLFVYTHLVFFTPTTWLAIVECVILGGLTAAIGFNIMHEHNIIHHTYTNIEGIDDDIEAKPLLRLCETQKHYKIHRFQHWYFWFAYSLLYIWWVLFTDYKKYFLGKIKCIFYL